MKKKAMIIGISIIILLGIILIVNIIVPSSLSNLLFNGVEVEEDTELTYYLTLSYEGKDKYGINSTTSSISQVNSGIIEITDKIPNGLIFLGFVESTDGTIGAVEQSNHNISCLGNVIDDTITQSSTSYHGLHYDEEERLVHFRVENLQAGCELTIGIRTKTPFIDDPATLEIETRRDFYNFSYISEKDNNNNSETVHVYMGNDDAILYAVHYEYSNPPPGAPPLENSSSYEENTEVTVNLEPQMEGYDFVGWTSNDVVITNGKFIMPNHEVTITGSFVAKPKYEVSYQITGTIPSEYTLPSTNQYYKDSYVTLDSLKAGDIIGNYRFLGWTNSEVLTESNQNYFKMPSHDIVITGQFEENKYNVHYEFYNTVLPPNADSLLPVDESYHKGDIVTLPTVNDVANYHFLGWYHDDSFMMPEEDITIYGEWQEILGTFTPLITKEVLSTKSYYRVNDIIQMKSTITNQENFAITDIYLTNNIDNFIEQNEYIVITNKIVKIPSIPANSSVVVYSSYQVQEQDMDTITTTTQITGALAENRYELAEGNYIDSTTSNLQSKITICCYINGIDDGNYFPFHIEGTTNQYETTMVLQKGTCESIYVDPETYKITEIIPQEYTIKTVTGSISSNGANLIVVRGSNYTINFTNEFIKKGYYHSFGRIKNQIEQGG